MRQLGTLINNPEEKVTAFAKASQQIEVFAKKASREIQKGTLLGYFYIAITLILLSLLAILAAGFIILIGHFFPKEYQWIVFILAAIPMIAVIYFFIKSVKSD